jgi:Mor family transcriptional regulator
MGRNGRATAPELVARLVEIGVDVFGKQLALPATRTRAAMREVAHTLCSEFGGHRLSIPMDIQYPLEQRDAKLSAAFTGNNIAELAADFDLTQQQVRNILAHVRRARSRGT